ncbi:hypothetical protein GLW05_20850 [Pontibacillus yanchengensis]|uniref:Uncharacterized protein n=1 Tax=Pontibacillus yanchengensis TaxID=462910 RepID=A0A6I5A6S5_9BACI|nr:hypothetical protein [Pontibacillus yanchengensis]MYL36023.1 hypothetical protein [Pontibacillus yanchengensis]
MKGRTTSYYSSVLEVMYYTNVSVEMIDPNGEMTEEQFIERIEEFLREASDYVERYTRRDFNKEVKQGKLETVYAGIHGITRRIVADLVAQAITRRDGNIFIVGESNEVLKDSVFNANVKKDLDMYKKRVRPRFSLTGVSKTGERDSGGNVEEGSGNGEEDELSYVQIKADEEIGAGSLINIYAEYELGPIKFRKADAELGFEAHGFIKEDTNIGDVSNIYLGGVITFNYSVLAGRSYYLGVDGKVVDKPNETFSTLQKVGYAVGNYDLMFSAEESFGG